MADRTLLVVDDETAFRTLVSRELSRAGYHVEPVDTIREARRHLSERNFQTVLLDMRLPDGNGLEFLPEIKEAWPDTEVVMLTAYGTVPQAIQAIKQGAYDFLTKPCKLDELEAVLDKAVKSRQLIRSHRALQIEMQRLSPTDGFVGEADQMLELREMLQRVAPTDSTVLIRGESGTGKELVARAVHRLSQRSTQPFVVVDCAALHENLLQSELFGHERGAYTGAVRRKEGLFEVADGGSIFLDEIGEITPAVQVKLLRVIETGTMRRLGSTADIKVDVRVIAATNRGLESMIKDGSFREDLYYRLNVFSLNVPPLRERRSDVPVLAQHFVRHSSIAAKRSLSIGKDALNDLTRYHWPGNVRELENVIERALILCDDSIIKPNHLPLTLRRGPEVAEDDSAGIGQSLESVEIRHIQKVLEGCQGHRQRAAEILGISERNLYRRLKAVRSLKGDTARG